MAIVVSVALLWLWAAVAPQIFPELARRPEPPKPAPATATAAQNAPAGTTSTVGSAPATAAPAAPPRAVQPIEAQAVTVSVVDTPQFVARISNRGAQIVSFQLKHYRTKSGQPVELVKSRDASRTDFPFSIEAADANVARTLNTALYHVDDQTTARGERLIQLRYANAAGVSATKTFRFTADYPFDYSVSVSPAVPYRVMIGPGIRTLEQREIDNTAVIIGSGIVQEEGELDVHPRDKGDRLMVFNAVDFLGIEDNYFLSVLRPQKSGGAVLRRVQFVGPKNSRRNEFYAGVNAAADGVTSGSVFFGPKETKLLDRVGMSEALQFGWFGIIARVLLEALVWINKWTLNYGWAIIVLTVIIKIVLYPLQHKSIVSMKKMQKVQPKMEAIKNKYKKARTDPEQRQKMNVEMMKLYQVEGINPMSGCIPILLQLPILWGFYGLLSRAIELRGAPWILWITDLSEKDPYYVTPFLMTVTMFIQTYITPTTGDPMQRRIFLIMPIIFGWLFKEFPSGLVLYWLVQNILTIIQQMIMNKWWKDHPEEVAKA